MDPDPPAPTPSRSLSPLEELRREVELGSPASLGRAVLLLQRRDLPPSAESRALTAAAAAIAGRLYPGSVALPPVEAPADHSYARIIRDINQGNYQTPSSASRDFLEYTLPFLALYNNAAGTGMDAAGTETARLRQALPHLERAAALNGESALPFLFRAFVLEKTGEGEQAEEAYQRALELAPDCYPAELGLARLYVQKQDWPRASAIVTELLRQNSRNGEALLIRARILLDQGFFQQAQTPLDTYASINTTNRVYLFLRARFQAEGNRNREAAISLLRPLYRANQDDPETALYLTSLLLESSRGEDNDEGRALLARFSGPNASSEALALAATDSIRRENWRDAKNYLDRLLPRRRLAGDILNAWKTERALGNNAAALAYARELYNRDNTNEEGITAYVMSLIDTGRQTEASRIIDQRLGAAASGTPKSRYYYLRSRTQSGEDAVMNDLRSALFEDPRNMDALVTMFEIYHRRKDERRAVYYLRQALVIAPNNPQLKRYEAEYRSLLGN
ncbi:hypothetical protein AGMMS50230_00600 [Spirochaetia bacterium]|nr:hypothetical protein AGMMS50230_00600 [Spirochaetia bacterium]